MACTIKKPVSISPGIVVEVHEDVYTIENDYPVLSGKRDSLFEVITQANGIAVVMVLGSIGFNAFPSGVKINQPIANLTNGSDLTGEVQAFKQGGQIAHNMGAAGGYLVGKKHSEGGIKGFNKSTGQPLEVEGGEVIITAPAVQDNEKRDFEGEQLTNREILSKINESGGGIAFAEGGQISSCRCSGKSYKYGGETMTDFQIIERINRS